MSSESPASGESAGSVSSAGAPVVGMVRPVVTPSVASGSGSANTATAPAMAQAPATAQAPANGQPADRETAREPLFTHALFRIVTALLGFQIVLLGGNLWFQFRNYATGIRLAEQAGATADIVSLILIYSRAWDFAVTKTSALFLGFVVIYLGALYVLRSADSAYEVTLNQGPQPGASLRSSSPGLLMVLLGTLLVALVLSNRSEVGFQVDPTGGAGGVAAVSASTATAAGSTSASPASATNPAPTSATAARPAAAPAAPARPAANPAAAAPVEDHRMPKLLDP